LKNQVPSQKEALNILVKSGCSESVICHCKSVSDLATRMAMSMQKKGVNVDVELVSIGALLHDIGRSKTHKIDHAVQGAKIAVDFCLPKSIVRIIEVHIGSGITAEEAEKLGIPKKDYLPKTIEEKVVSYADMLIENCREVSYETALQHFIELLGSSHPSINRFKHIHEELQRLMG
jgi:uncharacterized protein